MNLRCLLPIVNSNILAIIQGNTPIQLNGIVCKKKKKKNEDQIFVDGEFKRAKTTATLNFTFLCKSSKCCENKQTKKFVLVFKKHL